MNEQIEKILSLSSQDFEVFYKDFEGKILWLKTNKIEKYTVAEVQWGSAIQEYRRTHTLTQEESIRLDRIIAIFEENK